MSAAHLAEVRCSAKGGCRARIRLRMNDVPGYLAAAGWLDARVRQYCPDHQHAEALYADDRHLVR